MLDHLLSPAFVPFSLACGLLAALLLVEAVALLMGGSMMADGAEGPDFDPGSTFDIDADATPDLADLLVASDHALSTTPAGAGWLGLGHTPFMIWFSALLLGFGLSGLALQTVAQAVARPLPGWLAIPVAALAGLAFAARFARTFGRLLPGIETTATSAQFMGGLRGVVSQGIARQGAPAEVRLRDRHGNLHHMRCEPLLAGEVISEGTEVLTVRQRIPNGGGWKLCIIAIA